MTTKTSGAQAAPRTTRASATRPRRSGSLPRDEPVDLSSLTALVGFCVRIAQLQVFDQFHRDLWQRHGLHPGAYSVLAAVKSNPGVQPGVLARALAIKPPNLSKLLDQLERDNWLERRAEGADGRRVALFLTTRGARRIAVVAKEAMDMDEQATACLTKPERRQLVALLSKVTDNLRTLNESTGS